MRGALLGVLVLAIGQQGSVPVAEQYAALVKAIRSEDAAFRSAATDAERCAAVERLHVVGTRYADFAEAHASDPIVLEAALEAIRALNGEDSQTQVAWELNTTRFPEPGAGNPAGRIVALLLRDHLRSDQLVQICLRMCYGLRPEYEDFLKRVVEENPHQEVRGVACLSLAQFLNARLLKLDLYRERAGLAERYALLLGKEFHSTSAEVEALFTRAAESFGDVKHPYGGTIGEQASAQLFELRNLVVGKTPPDIEGVDQDGRPLKLSEYRGRVVLLDFWSEF